MSSLFDPQQFLENTEFTGEMSTKRELVPPGRYNMQIEKFVAKKVIPDEAGKEPFSTIDVTLIVDGSSLDATGKPVKETTGMDQNRVRFSGYLDFTETGSLDLGKGRNIALGQLRAAANQNDPTKPWKMNQLIGQVVNGEVYHRQDKKHPENFYVEVKGLMPMQ